MQPPPLSTTTPQSQVSCTGGAGGGGGAAGGGGVGAVGTRCGVLSRASIAQNRAIATRARTPIQETGQASRRILGTLPPPPSEIAGRLGVEKRRVDFLHQVGRAIRVRRRHAEGIVRLRTIERDGFRPTLGQKHRGDAGAEVIVAPNLK